MNRCALFSLSAAALSLGLVSCGGGGSNDGECLPPGAMLDLTASLSTEDGTGPWNIIIKLAGNGTDLPQVSINAASTTESSSMNPQSVVYRRTESSAILRGNFTVRSGQWTAPGPVITTNKDKVFVDASISFNSSDANQNSRGTFTGNVTYEVYEGEDESGTWIPWSAAEGEVNYTVS